LQTNKKQGSGWQILDIGIEPPTIITFVT